MKAVISVLGLFVLACAAFFVRMVIIPDVTPEGDPASGLAATIAQIVSPQTLAALLVPPSGETQTHFFIEIGGYASVIVAANLGLALLWYATLSLLFGVERWNRSHIPRRLWWAMLVGAVVISEAPFFLISVQSGGWLLLVFGAVTPLLVFYLGTCLFSPVSHKYVAPLSVSLRQGW